MITLLLTILFGSNVIYVENIPEPKLVVVTGYSSTESQTDDTPFIMASGKRVYDGAIACPRKYKFGQKVEITGKIYTCEDRKNIRYESYPEEWFDIWFESQELALNWGIEKLRVFIK